MILMTGRLFRKFREHYSLNQEDLLEPLDLKDRSSVTKIEKQGVVPGDITNKLLNFLEISDNDAKELIAVFNAELQNGLNDNNSSNNKGTQMKEEIDNFLYKNWQETEKAQKEIISKLEMEKAEFQKQVQGFQNESVAIRLQIQQLIHEIKLMELKFDQKIKALDDETQKALDDEIKALRDDMQQFVDTSNDKYDSIKKPSVGLGDLLPLMPTLLEKVPDFLKNLKSMAINQQQPMQSPPIPNMAGFQQPTPPFGFGANETPDTEKQVEPEQKQVPIPEPPDRSNNDYGSSPYGF